jgi:hypothetical protein
MFPINLSTLLKAGALSALTALVPLLPVTANALDCSDMPASLTSDPLRAEGFRVVATNKLYRLQERPWAHIPTGATVRLRAPAGVTSADIHRAAVCSAGNDSPVAVPGAQLRVTRDGDSYELKVTAESRDAALEIQRRAIAL